MSEREKLEVLLKEVKQKIRMLDAIEESLFVMLDIATKSSDSTLQSMNANKCS